MMRKTAGGLLPTPARTPDHASSGQFTQAGFDIALPEAASIEWIIELEQPSAWLR